MSQELRVGHQHAACAAFDQLRQDNLRELMIQSAGPDDLISYIYTLHPPSTKMELILGFLFPNWHYIHAIHSAPEDLRKTVLT